MLLPGPLNYPDPEKTVVLPANHHPPLLEVRGRARGQRSSEAGRAGLEISAQGRTVVARKSLQLQDLSQRHQASNPGGGYRRSMDIQLDDHVGASSSDTTASVSSSVPLAHMYNSEASVLLEAAPNTHKSYVFILGAE